MPNYIKCLVGVSYSYNQVKFNTCVIVKIIDDLHISLNDILDGLSKQIILNNFAISYCEYDNNTNIYVNVGRYPLENNYLIGYNIQSLTNPNIITHIRIKLRQIIIKEYPLKQDLIEEDIENIEDKNIISFINHKSKRAKERKIGYIIKKVFMWKTLYNGIYSVGENGNKIKIKYTLEQASNKAGISKKSLDDYLIQLRIGKFFNYNFTEYKNDKVGILRAFVKKNKPQYEKEKYSNKNETITSFINKKKKISSTII
jgi:hypothetical protein